jgi:hypothetical protein
VTLETERDRLEKKPGGDVEALRKRLEVIRDQNREAKD